MRTELPRPFSSAFVLGKTDLEGVHDLLVRQMEGNRTPPNQYTATYEVRFRYGAIQERTTLQDILNEPNGGELTIVGIKIRLEDKNTPKDRNITLQFSDVRGLPNPSIYYNIVGTDPAWVNDTDTKLATRIRGLKIFSFSSLAKRLIPEGNSGFILLLLLFFTVIPLLASGFVYSSLAILVVTLLILLVIWCVYQAIVYFFPPYNFCWGAYATSFNRRRTIGLWIFSAVFVAIVIGILVNFISTRILH